MKWQQNWRVRQQEHDPTGDLFFSDPLACIVQRFPKIFQLFLEASSFCGTRHSRQEPDSRVVGLFRLSCAVFRRLSIPYLEFGGRKTCERAAAFHFSSNEIDAQLLDLGLEARPIVEDIPPHPPRINDDLSGQLRGSQSCGINRTAGSRGPPGNSGAGWARGFSGRTRPTGRARAGRIQRNKPGIYIPHRYSSSNNTQVVVASITVPPGNYLLHGTAHIFNHDSDSQPTQCLLSTSPEDFDLQAIPGNNLSDFTLQDWGTFSGTITMTCGTFNGSALGRLSAIAVDAIF